MSADVETLEALLARVERATGADREIDAAISGALLKAERERAYRDWQAMRPKGSPEKAVSEYWQRRATALTSSLDAAVALVEKVLPGWGWSIERYGKTADASIIEIMPHIDERDRETNAVASTAPLALLAALLRALIARAKAEEAE